MSMWIQVVAATRRWNCCWLRRTVYVVVVVTGELVIGGQMLMSVLKLCVCEVSLLVRCERGV